MGRGRLRRLLALPPGERFRTLEAAAMLTLVSAALRTLPFRLVVRCCGDLDASVPSPDRVQSREAAAVSRAILRAARHLPWRPSCLRRAVAGRLMLNRRGIPATLFLGVTTGDGGVVEAHAWLCAGSVAVAGTRVAARYAPIARFSR